MKARVIGVVLRMNTHAYHCITDHTYMSVCIFFLQIIRKWTVPYFATWYPLRLYCIGILQWAYYKWVPYILWVCFLCIHLKHTHSQFWGVLGPPRFPQSPCTGQVWAPAAQSYLGEHPAGLEWLSLWDAGTFRACRWVSYILLVYKHLMHISSTYPGWAAHKSMSWASFIDLSCSFLISKMKELFWMVSKNSLNSKSIWVYDS